jgi:hypothetical protein
MLPGGYRSASRSLSLLRSDSSGIVSLDEVPRLSLYVKASFVDPDLSLGGFGVFW